MKKISLCLFLAICITLCHSGCGGGEKERAYRAFCTAYEGEARWEINGVAYAGYLTIGEGETPAERGAGIRYTAPVSLAGLQVNACEEGARLSLGGSTHLLTGEAAARFLAVFRLFSPVAATPDATGALRYTAGQESYTIRLDETGLVREICYISPALTLSLWPGGED